MITVYARYTGDASNGESRYTGDFSGDDDFEDDEEEDQDPPPPKKIAPERVSQRPAQAVIESAPSVEDDFSVHDAEEPTESMNPEPAQPKSRPTDTKAKATTVQSQNKGHKEPKPIEVAVVEESIGNDFVEESI